MLQITIDEKLKELGKSRYWLSKEIKMTYPNLSKLCKNETSSIQFLHLEKICKTLNCKPNDIISII